MEDVRKSNSTLRSKTSSCIVTTRSDPVLYPQINWWPGKLLPFESPLFFAAKFCTLNGIGPSQYESFFGYKLGGEARLTQEDIYRIATLLNEDLSLVQSVFIPTIHLWDCGHYRLPNLKHASHEIRYCQRCVEFGYHSYLHEARWLAQCPFHFTTLKTTGAFGNSGTISIRRLDGLRHLMMTNCRAWPRSNAGDFETSKFGGSVFVELLSAWTRNARGAAAHFSKGQFWETAGVGHFTETSYKCAIGRLRKLEPMPAIIKPLFSTIGETWQVETRDFPLESKAELHRLSKYAGFEVLFDFYKSVSVRSNNPPPFIMKLRAIQTELKERHGKCRCQWGREKVGSRYHWVITHPDEWPHWGCQCPYEVAVEELELGWGHPDRVLSSRQAEDERLRFIQLSRIMHDAGLIEYSPDASVSPEGYLYAYPQIWPCCEWKKTSPLTELFNTTAEFEIDAALTEINIWLAAIERGGAAYARESMGKCVRLCKTERGLTLVKWSPEVELEQ